MDTSFSYSLRVAACDRCGAPTEASIAGGGFTCRFCNAQNMLAVRSEERLIAPGRVPLAEPERLARLRQQDGKPLMPPANLQHLMPNGSIEAWKVDEAVTIWNAARQELRGSPSNYDAAERIVFLAMMLAQHFRDKGDKLRQRSLLEGTLDVVTLPRHRQNIRGFLARAAVRAGDLAAAEQWLAPCDQQSDDLQMDSEWRFARAFIDTAKGNFPNVIAVLGSGLKDVPIEDGSDEVCTVLRANAHERMGRLDLATSQLREQMEASGGQGRAWIQQVIQNYPDWQLCAQSHPIAAGEQAKAAGAAAASTSSGGLPYAFIPMGIGIAGLGVWMFGTGVTTFFAGADPVNVSDRWKFLGFGPLCFLLGLLFFVIGIAVRKSSKHKEWLHVNGRVATAQIKALAPTGTKIGAIPVMRYALLVTIPGEPPYDAETNHLGNAGPEVIGRTVSVRVHPQNKTDLIIE